MTPAKDADTVARDVDTVPPTVGDVDRVAAHPDPVIRNLMITHCYHQLSRALVAFTGGSANWCTFAVWASKQVGQTIRREDAERAVERVLAEAPEASAVVGAVADALRRVAPRQAEGAERVVRGVVVTAARLDHVSAAAAAGNVKVFAEIAREAARFLTEFPDPPARLADRPPPPDDRLAAFCAGLRPGPPPEGQDLLRKAFTHYYRAGATADPKRRAELLLLANIEIGLHEQTRLQPEIAAALNAPVVDPREVERRLLDLVLPANPVLKHLRLAVLTLLRRRNPLRDACERLADLVRTLTRRAVTRLLMALALPDGTRLDLGEDLAAPFPPHLVGLSDPDLLALLRQVDPTPNSTRETSAGDWSDLPDRMHFIADMFRCFADRADLLGPPFTPDQVEALMAGRRPAGRL